MGMTNENAVCHFCSAECVTSMVWSHTECLGVYGICKRHAELSLDEQIRLHKLTGQCTSRNWESKPRRQLANRGDFAIDKATVGAQGENRYWLCGPDAAMQDGVTLENLRAVWHLIGEVIEGESAT